MCVCVCVWEPSCALGVNGAKGAKLCEWGACEGRDPRSDPQATGLSRGEGWERGLWSRGTGWDDVPSSLLPILRPVAPIIPHLPPPRGPGRAGHLPGREEKIAAALFSRDAALLPQPTPTTLDARTHEGGRAPGGMGGACPRCTRGRRRSTPTLPVLRPSPNPSSLGPLQKAMVPSPLPPSLTLSFFRSFSIAPVVSQWCSSDSSYISPLVRDPSFPWRYAIIHTLWALLCAFASSAMALSGGGGGGGGGLDGE